MTQFVRRAVLNYFMGNKIGTCDERDIERLRKEDKWIIRCLEAAEGTIDGAILRLVGMLGWRTVNGVHKALKARSLDDYKKMICEHGKDKKGNPLLMMNITEMEKMIKLGIDDTCLQELIIKWFEEMDSQKEVTKISVVFYHGDNKYMDNVVEFLQLVLDISEGFMDFIDTLYVFEDVLSFNQRRLLEDVLSFNQRQRRWLENVVSFNQGRLLDMNPILYVCIKYVNQKNCKELINLDLPAYEKENSSDKKVKNVDPVQMKTETTNKRSNSKQKGANKKIENAVKDDKAKGVQSEVAKEESKEVSEDIGEEKTNKDTKEAIKMVLKRLQKLQLEINLVIKDVTNLL